MRWPWLLVMAALPGCGLDDVPFRCDADAQCVQGNTTGQCEVSGYCSFPDSSCTDSKRRYGKLAPSELANRCVPECVQKLALGGQFSCALRTDGRVFCWGEAQDGELGNGKTSEASHPTPLEVAGIGQSVDLAAGGFHACSINQASGDVWCWGSNSTLQLGSTKPADTGPIEILPKGHSNAPSVQVTAGGVHTCARGSYGIECWGSNQYGQLGSLLKLPLSATPLRAEASGFTIPSTQAEKVVAGATHTCAKLPNGALWCWGNNAAGELGEPANNPDKETTPVQVASSLSGFVDDMALGIEFTCVIANGKVKCWGQKPRFKGGQDPPDEVPLDASATEICAGGAHACVVLGDGRAECWGSNEVGQLGPNVATPFSPPVVIDLGVPVAHIACGSKHTCALGSNDRVYCWGENEQGELGNGESGATAPHPEPDSTVTSALCSGL